MSRVMTVPHDNEVERALLGSILINNEAFYCVCDFLEPRHFFEPLHGKIYEDAGNLVRHGKLATPVTLKALHDIKYTVQLAAEAPIPIHAEDYGLAIYALSTLIIGEPVDLAPLLSPDVRAKNGRIQDRVTLLAKVRIAKLPMLVLERKAAIVAEGPIEKAEQILKETWWEPDSGKKDRLLKALERRSHFEWALLFLRSIPFHGKPRAYLTVRDDKDAIATNEHERMILEVELDNVLGTLLRHDIEQSDAEPLAPRDAIFYRNSEWWDAELDQCRDRALRQAVDAAAYRAKQQKKQEAAMFYESREWLDLRYQALKLHGAACQCCGAKATPGHPLHVDHIKPRSKFPELELVLENLQVLCDRCNLGKSNRDETDWRPAQVFEAGEGGTNHDF